MPRRGDNGILGQGEACHYRFSFFSDKALNSEVDACRGNGGCGRNSICHQPERYRLAHTNLVQCICEEGYAKHPDINACVSELDLMSFPVSQGGRSLVAPSSLDLRSPPMGYTQPEIYIPAARPRAPKVRRKKGGVI